MKKTILLCVAAVAALACGPEFAPPAERDAYIGQVELEGVRVGETMTGRKNVYGQLNNKGDKTLAAVLVKIDYLDDQGKPIASMTHTIGDKLGPKASKDFRIPANDAPEKWAGKVEVALAELSFAN